MKKLFFVRLSSRSPKDVGLSEEHPQFLKILHEELLKKTPLKRKPVKPLGGIEDIHHLAASLDENSKRDAVLTTSSRLLRVTTAKDALWLIQNSERTYSDLIHAVQHWKKGQKVESEKHNWGMKLVVRKWDDRVYLGNEFRGFVCNGKLTAFCQYNDTCYYSHLLNKEKELREKLRLYWEKIAPMLSGYPVAVVDFVLLYKNEIKVVEINPFGPMTGASLFNWVYDRSMLQGGYDLWGDLQEHQKKIAQIEEPNLIEPEDTAAPPVVRLKYPKDFDATAQAHSALFVIYSWIEEQYNLALKKKDRSQPEQENSRRCSIS